ncbi:hypothetical protein [Microvirga sp. CF3016]|uniref:hypothetical protein n=1 Tax=Microvirga sp. CF3016 TaxID=3110181 RepID=UPI002E796853|nr:hypothetical protein [Microvirga sp. CF3016]MEE1609938.1 hypothetical protein [Microvirga sp. CF3016]
MPGASNLQTELDALKADLRMTDAPEASTAAERLQPKGRDPAAKSIGAKTEYEEHLRELGKILSDYTGSIEEFVKEHQLASVLAAFVLGVAAGRVMGRA